MRIKYNNKEYSCSEFFNVMFDESETAFLNLHPKKEVEICNLSFLILEEVIRFLTQDEVSLPTVARFIASFIDRNLIDNIEIVPETSDEKKMLFDDIAVMTHLHDQLQEARRRNDKETIEKIMKGDL